MTQAKNGVGIDRTITLFALLLGAFVTVTTCVGVWRFGSATIFWDEWDGYLGFYRRIHEVGGVSPWFENHVQHRIFTTRVLAWLDITLFHGSHAILFIGELVTLGGVVYFIAKRSAGAARVLAIGLGAALLYSWSQSESLTWGFVFQVTSAYFFAVWSIYAFTREEWSAYRRFGIALVMSILSELSMGNGLGVPLVLLALTVVLRRPLKEGLAALLIAVVTIPPYFYHLAPADGPRPESEAGSHLLFLLKFFALTLGNPLCQINAAISVSMLVGAMTFVASLVLVAWLWLRKRVTWYRGFLIGVWLFAVACVVMVTLGRSGGGYSQAVLSRYATGSLLVWFAFAMLAYDVLPLRPRRIVTVLMLLLAAVTAVSQKGAFADNSYIYERKLGLLSNKIGLDREGYLLLSFPQAEPWRTRFVDYTKWAAAHRFGIFSQAWLQDAGVVRFDPQKLATDCVGHFDRSTTDADGVQVASGWVLAKRDTLIVLTDGSGKTVGYGLVGRKRPDVAAIMKGSGSESGWIGFARPGAHGLQAFVYRTGRFCRVSSD
ncbi:hypothetical protein [Paraburkholderia acidisoli]|uniref:Glycosyltransferase RgtA/B/C/D-like domain-containing protein n=1 Tax=Paraburkholderia acidisoli TaxID=2571748 RepID=A0A7Z2JDP2_9BURK|nr:hypothetical protein [Paraburkholderia acidisoli]QGZ60816.1 hypothetical protein FAZ98_03175 [Paraburkholderia acidisoli]